MESNQKATLGCGTLILIAIIVMIFSGANDSGVKPELHQLQTQIQRLESAIQAQRASIEKLERAVDALRAQPSPGDSKP